MSSKTLTTFLLAIARTMLGGIVGFVIGILLHFTVLPFWTVSSIGSAPKDAETILYIDYEYISDSGFGKNSIFIQSQSGKSYQVTNGKWMQIEGNAEKSEEKKSSKCASKWLLPTFRAIDSSGTVFEHALANEYVCYLLLKDGQLQVWTRWTDVFTMIKIAASGTVIGMIIGFIAGSILNFFKRKRF